MITERHHGWYPDAVNEKDMRTGAQSPDTFGMMLEWRSLDAAQARARSLAA